MLRDPLRIDNEPTPAVLTTSDNSQEIGAKKRPGVDLT
jgi:hypothetical protein